MIYPLSAKSQSIVSDDFNSSVVNTSLWTFINLGTPSTLSIQGAGTQNARLLISIPAGSSHDAWTGGNFAPRVMQPSGNTDFQIEVKFESILNAAYQIQGVIVQQDNNNYLRFDFVKDATKTKIFAASFIAGIPTTRYNAQITAASPLYLRVKRQGNQWTQTYSLNGSTWSNAANFNHSLVVSSVGPFIGNAGTSPPAFTGVIDYFFNRAFPITPEDGAVIPTITSHPAQQTVPVGQTATFAIAASGTPPLSYQWQKNGVNIPGATAVSYTTPVTSLADSGSTFRCVVSNTPGSSTSNVATLTVLALAPIITTHPSNKTIGVGESTTFSVIANGTGPLTYQWQQNDLDIPGATNAAYTTPATSAIDSGSTFRCVVNNPYGTVTSNRGTLNVLAPPNIVAQPLTQIVLEGQAVTFSTVATGSGTLSYQWQKNGSAIAGATGISYTIASAMASDNGSVFRCIATNSVGRDTTNNATLTVQVPPHIVQQPAAQTIAAGQSATFSIGVSGDTPFTFQWQWNNVDIPGAVDSNYTTPTAIPADSGSTFRCIVTNPFGTITSNPASLFILTPPDIYAHPASQPAIEGETATFTVAATGNDPLQYQWQKNGVNISSATTPSYTTPPTTEADHGSEFRCVVYNGAGRDTSDSGLLTVHVPATITVQPTHQNIAAGQNAIFTIGARGTAPLLYQWQRNNADIAGATDSTYTTPTTGTDSGAVFRCIVLNAFDTVVTVPAILNVGIPPSISTEPAGQTVESGQTAVFSVAATGSTPLSYQWKRNNQPIAGAINSSYTTPSTTAVDNNASFLCSVTNLFGGVNSAIATLTVTAPSDTISPLIQNVQATPVKISATITWVTDEPASSQITYGSTTSYENGSVSDPAIATQHSITLTGLSAGITYHYRISSADNNGNSSTTTDLTFTTISTILSDDFNSYVLNPGVWTFTNPGDAAVNISGTNTPNARLNIVVPPGSSHDVWTDGNFAPRVMQSAPNANFEIEVKFEVLMAGQYQTQGVLVQQDSVNFLRFDFVRSNTGTKIFAASFVNGIPTVRKNLAITNNNPLYLRLKRIGNQWTQSFSLNGTGYTIAVTFSHTLVVRAMGVFAGNAGTSPPAFTSPVDYFLNTALPFAQEDGGTATSTPIITSQPLPQVKSAGETASFNVTAIGTQPITYQWQKNGVDIPGATSPAYTTSPLILSDSGASFRCRLSNPVGTTLSVSAQLSVNPTSPLVLRFQRITVDGSNTKDHPCKAVGDINGDGFTDILAASDVDTAEGVFWYKYPGWTKHLIHTGTFNVDMQVADVDGDGDLDVVIPKSTSPLVGARNCVWYENPRPTGNPETGQWTEHVIGDARGHEVQFGDINRDGKLDVIVRDDTTVLFIQRSPNLWTKSIVSMRLSQGTGLGDIDNDGDLDIGINGYWLENTMTPADSVTGFWTEYLISATWPSQIAVHIADLNMDGRLDVLYAPCHISSGRCSWYEAINPKTGPWVEHIIDSTVSYLHGLKTADIDNDGDLDIATAEMHQSDDPDEVSIHLNSGGALSWSQLVIDSVGSHNIRITDIGNDGDIDIVGANWSESAPFGSRIDLWENISTQVLLSLDNWQRHVIDPGKPWRGVFVSSADIDGDTKKDILTGGWWYRNPGVMAGNWTRTAIGSPLNNMGAVYDFDGDGDADVVGTKGQGSNSNSEFVWARNNGTGSFTILSNVQPGIGDFLQGAAVARFTNGGPLELALSWHDLGVGVQMLSIPTTPSDSTWGMRTISATSQDEQLSSGDIDRDGDMDLLLGTKWLRNDGATWASFPITDNLGAPDRNRLVDVNRDGRLDAVVGFEAISIPGKLSWYAQPAVPTDLWIERVISSSTIGPMSLDVADFDGDGDSDVVVGEHNLATPDSAKLIIFANTDGAGNVWMPHIISTGDEHHDGSQVVDIDNDGDFDIISIGWNNTKVLLYENKAVESPPSADGITATGLEAKKLLTSNIPVTYCLYQNYPNPFNPSTVIRYDLPTEIHVILKLYNILGQEVATLVNEVQDSGFRSVELNANSIASGLYLYRLTAGSFTLTKKMLLLK